MKIAIEWWGCEQLFLCGKWLYCGKWFITYNSMLTPLYFGKAGIWGLAAPDLMKQQSSIVWSGSCKDAVSQKKSGILWSVHGTNHLSSIFSDYPYKLVPFQVLCMLETQYSRRTIDNITADCNWRKYRVCFWNCREVTYPVAMIKAKVLLNNFTLNFNK